MSACLGASSRTSRPSGTGYVTATTTTATASLTSTTCRSERRAAAKLGRFPRPEPERTAARAELLPPLRDRGTSVGLDRAAFPARLDLPPPGRQEGRREGPVARPHGRPRHTRRAWPEDRRALAGDERGLLRGRSRAPDAGRWRRAFPGCRYDRPDSPTRAAADPGRPDHVGDRPGGDRPAGRSDERRPLIEQRVGCPADAPGPEPPGRRTGGDGDRDPAHLDQGEPGRGACERARIDGLGGRAEDGAGRLPRRRAPRHAPLVRAGRQPHVARTSWRDVPRRRRAARRAQAADAEG